jgi:hypothetical protein
MKFILIYFYFLGNGVEMLKWTVGHKTGPSPCCSAMRRPPFRLHIPGGKTRRSHSDKENSDSLVNYNITF